jgi:predicted Ser/Thr protein kinase
MMKTSDSSNACPKCGAPVPFEAPQGLCPQCVFAQAAAPEAAPTATSQIPSLERLAVAFPQLQILELIGRGGMGFVFKARQPHLDRFVALKLLPDSLAHDPHFAERFNREGRTLARLNHPNIVSIFDFGQAGGFYFLLMEYVDGVNLRQAMQAGKFSPSEALAIVPKICEALQFAHEEGILHRDIKPENILLDAKGRVKIADFGIAKIVGEDKPDVSLTATGAALGTPHYMAPEQFEKPATVDHRADIYSLGVVFYEMLTGELPIGRFSPPSQRTPLDPRVDDVVMRTLEKEREKRFQSAGEMGTNVEHLTDSGAGKFSAPPPKIPGASERGPRGTVVIKSEDVLLNVPKWSLKAVWGAVLVAISFVPIAALLAVIFYFTANHRIPPGGPSTVLMLLVFVIISLPAIAGTILGWTGLSDIRAHRGQLRGLPLAVFAALVWPLLLFGTLTIWIIVAPVRNFSSTAPLASGLLMLVPAGLLTFMIWAVYTATRTTETEPVASRRGMLKWIFLGLMLFGAGVILAPKASKESAPVPVPIAAVVDTNTTPWIRFTFTAVELREVKGVRWLAIDYLDDVHGECQKSFPWETTIPGFTATTRATEFVTDAKDSSPAVRHQRIEYRMPDSSPREQLERLRDELEKTLKQKSFRLELGENEVPLTLFELPGVEGGSLKARIKVVPPLTLPQPSGSPEYRQGAARLESLLKREQELLAQYTDENPLVKRVREQIAEAEVRLKRLEPASPSERGANPLALQFRLVADDADAATPVDVMMESRGNGTSVPRRVLRTVLLDGSAVARAGFVLETNDHRTIGVELTTEGARQFGAITAANINRQLAIVSGGRVLSAPIIRTAITEGELQISGNMSAAERHKLVAELNRKPAGLEFSATVERSLPRAPEFPPGAICLDLESGLFMTNRTFRADQRGTRDWLQTSGVDLLAIGTAEQIPVMSAYDLAFIEAPTNAWNSLPPQDVGWNWILMRDAAKQESQLGTMPGRPDTFLFRTRENGFGLLQILSAADPSPVVKIRYKLVKDVSAK